MFCTTPSKMLAAVHLAAVTLIALSPSLAQEVRPDPHETGRPHLSVFTHADYARRPAEAGLIQNLERQPLLDFAQGCRFRHYTTADPIYLERYAGQFPASQLPAICVQRPDGGVIYKATGDNLPADPGQLLEEIRFYRGLEPALHQTVGGLLRNSAGSLADAPSYRPEQCGPDGCPPRNPYQPYREPYRDPSDAQPALPDSAELFGGRTPIRDSLASMASIAFAIVGAFFLVIVVIVALIILVLIRPREK